MKVHRLTRILHNNGSVRIKVNSRVTASPLVSVREAISFGFARYVAAQDKANHVQLAEGIAASKYNYVRLVEAFLYVRGLGRKVLSLFLRTTAVWHRLATASAQITKDIRNASAFTGRSRAPCCRRQISSGSSLKESAETSNSRTESFRP